MSLNLAHFLELTVRERPDQTALILDDFRMTYRELGSAVNRVAASLVDMGVERGDKVAVMLPNTLHFSIVYFGILAAGATVVPINVLLRAQEIVHHVDDSEAKAFFVWKGFAEEATHAFGACEGCHHLIIVAPPGDNEKPVVGENLNRLLTQASDQFEAVTTMPDDTAVILYTSGTTGRPKGAELTHFNMFFNALVVRDRVTCVQPGDVALAILPLFHSFGQTCIQNATLLGGGTITMLPRFETKRAMEIIQRDKVTILAAVPTMYYFILGLPEWEDYDFSSLRTAISGGSSMAVETLHKFEERYKVQVLEGYGLSETSPVASFNVRDFPCKPGSIGRPIWGCDMRVLREDNTFADVDEVGEIVIKGHNVMKGYFNRTAATEETMFHGWLRTGDLGKMDQDGYFFIVDRKKDLIIRGGQNVYPREIEEVLYGHPAVLEAAVVGIPDEVRGEEVKAYVSLKDGNEVTPEEVMAYCRERMARYKCPSVVQILPQLPKGPTGKILKRDLRAANGEPRH